MKIEIEKSLKIKDLGDWFKYAPPKGEEKQWVKGRSALEMAAFALSKGFPTEIKKVLKECGFSPNHNFICEPEAETRFPSDRFGIGGPRNHDLLMVSDDLIIGIEAKVSESFDKKISERRHGASDNLNMRIDAFASMLYGDKVPKNFNDLRYQLFSATIGTIIEAQQRSKSGKPIKNCLMLVVVFSGKGVKAENNYSDKVKTNDADYIEFCRSLGLPDNGGRIEIEGINCWIKKITVRI